MYILHSSQSVCKLCKMIYYSRQININKQKWINKSIGWLSILRRFENKWRPPTINQYTSSIQDEDCSRIRSSPGSL